jgi:hypothetical protein
MGCAVGLKNLGDVMLKSIFSRGVALVLGSMMLGVYQGAEAGEAVDQSFTNPPYASSAATSLSGDTLFAQSFTAGAAGLLTGADVLAFDATSWYGANSRPVSDMTVQIRPVSGGVPMDTVLASYTVPASNLMANPNGEFTHVDFPTGVVIVPGQVLALTIGGAGVGCYLQLGSDATYAGGSALVKGHAGYAWAPYPDPGGRSADFLFRTYMKVPVPVSARMVSSQLTNGVLCVRFAGTSNHLFTVYRSGNSAGPWQWATNLTSDASGKFELFDPVSPIPAAGFYRVR